MTSYFYDEIDSVETAHSKLHEALRLHNTDVVAAILKEEPKAALPRPGWVQEPLGQLIGNSWGKNPEDTIKCLKLLLEAGADPNMAHNHQQAPIKLIIQMGLSGALECVMESGNLRMETQKLIGQVMMGARDGGTTKHEYPMLEMFKTLVRSGVSIVGEDKVAPIDEISRIHAAPTTKPHPDLLPIINLFLDHGAAVSTKACKLAISGGHPDIIQLLVSKSSAPIEDFLEGVTNAKTLASLERIIMDVRTPGVESEPRQKAPRL